MARRLRPTGSFHTLGHFDVPNFGHGRRVRIYVPHDFPRDGTRPALYMFDGQNTFGDEGSFAGGWHAHAAVDRLSTRTSHVPLVVAIDNGGDKRIDELAPWKHGEIGGRADDFLGWVVGTIVPKVQREYSLLPGAVGAVIAGSSLGGLAALYAHFRYPETFGGALAMSPSMWLGRGAIFDYVRNQPPPYYSRVYLDGGLKEGGGRMANALGTLGDAFRHKGYRDDRLLVRVDKRGGHNEKHWRRRLPRALRFMFKR